MHASSITRRRFLTLSGAATGLLAARSLAPAFSLFPDRLADAKATARAVNAFAADLLPQLAREAHGTLFFSPFSIATALSMAGAGARGTTLAEMRKVLHLTADPHPGFRDLQAHLNGNGAVRGYELATANALWAMAGYPWRTEFLDVTRKNYGAGLIETDFGKPEAARKQINGWVERQTHEKVKELIPKGVIDFDTRLVLTNAVYFKGEWASRFNEKLTRTAPFTRVNDTRAEVHLMEQTGTFSYGEWASISGGAGSRLQVIGLPYAGGELSMRVYLPAVPADVDRLPGWIVAGKDEALRQQEVQVFLPRFKAESEFSLRSQLSRLGMHAAFGAADFSGLNGGSEPLSISDVLHKAFVEVTESGSEAAGATGVVFKRVSLPEPSPVFRADRPFVFTIRDTRTGVILFMGRFDG